MELLGPFPLINRISLPVSAMDINNPTYSPCDGGASAFGGTGTEMSVCNLGQLEYTVTNNDGSTLTITPLVDEGESSYQGQKYRLGYMCAAPSGGTFTFVGQKLSADPVAFINYAPPIPYNADGPAITAILSGYKQLNQLKAVGGPLDTDDVLLYGVGFNGVLTQASLDTTKLVPPRLTVRADGDRLKQTDLIPNPIQVISSINGTDRRIVVTRCRARTGMQTSKISQTILSVNLGLGQLTNDFHMKFSLSYTRDPADSGTFSLNGSRTVEFQSSGFIPSDSQYWHTDELAFDADGPTIAQAVVDALNLVSVVGVFNTFGVPSQYAAVPVAFTYTASIISASPGKLNTAVVGVTLDFELLMRSNSITVIGPNVIAGGLISLNGPARCTFTPPAGNTQNMQKPNVLTYDENLNLISQNTIFNDIIRIQPSPDGFRVICMPDDPTEDTKFPTVTFTTTTIGTTSQTIKYVYRAYDFNWILQYEDNLFPTDTIPPTIFPQIDQTYATGVTNGFRLSHPLVTFSDGSYGAFQRLGRYVAINSIETVSTFYRRYGADNTVQYSAVTYNITKLCGPDAGDNMIGLAVRYIPPSGAQVSIGGIVKFDKNMNVLYIANSNYSSMCAACDSQLNVYVLGQADGHTRSAGYYLSKYDPQLELISVKRVIIRDQFEGAPSYDMRIQNDIITIYGDTIQPNVTQYISSYDTARY